MSKKRRKKHVARAKRLVEQNVVAAIDAQPKSIWAKINQAAKILAGKP